MEIHGFTIKWTYGSSTATGATFDLALYLQESENTEEGKRHASD